LNASLWSANAVTHTKIIVASLAAATVFVAVGITAQISNGHQQASASPMVIGIDETLGSHGRK